MWFCVCVCVCVLQKRLNLSTFSPLYTHTCTHAHIHTHKHTHTLHFTFSMPPRCSRVFLFSLHLSLSVGPHLCFSSRPLTSQPFLNFSHPSLLFPLYCPPSFSCATCLPPSAQGTFSPYWGEYNTTSGPVPGKINVHLVPHTQ